MISWRKMGIGEAFRYYDHVACGPTTFGRKASIDQTPKQFDCDYSSDPTYEISCVLCYIPVFACIILKASEMAVAKLQ
jgi:Zn-finger protein